MDLLPVDKVEIITLEDNFIDLVSMDNTSVVTRAMPLSGLEFKNSVLAEHGYAALVRATRGQEARTLVFDFGFSEDVAVRNASALSLDLSQAEAAVLSHGHLDHFGGLLAVGKKIGRQGMELVAHPEVFKAGRFFEPMPGLRISMPVIGREAAEKAGFRVVESREPRQMLGGNAVFLGEIPRETPFEKGMPNAYYIDKDGGEHPDPITDDSALALNVEGRGLVVLSGCSHAGIINTVRYAQKVTGVSRVHAVVGGFHLTGPAFASVIGPTVEALREIAPDYVVPTHCTGRAAVMEFERRMPKEFVLNMAGTTLTFQK